MPNQRRCPALSLVPSHPIRHPPLWLLVLGWDNWSTWSINVYMHIYGTSGKMSHLSCPIPSCPVPSHTVLSHPVWANWWLLVLGWDNWPTWTINVYMHIYGISGKMSHLSHPVPSHPIPSCPVWANWWLLVLGWDNWPTWTINVYMHIYSISGKMSHLSHPVPSHPVPSHPVPSQVTNKANTPGLRTCGCPVHCFSCLLPVVGLQDVDKGHRG